MPRSYKTLFTKLGFYPSRPEATRVTFTEGELRQSEEKLGNSIPQDYRQFLLECPSLTPGEIDCFLFQSKNGKEEALILELYGAPPEGDLADGYFSTRSAFEDDENYSRNNYPGVRLLRDMTTISRQAGWPEELLSIGVDPGGNEICLAFKGLRPGAIFFWRVNPWPDEDNLYFVANSFDEFIHNLRKIDS